MSNVRYGIVFGGACVAFVMGVGVAGCVGEPDSPVGSESIALDTSTSTSTGTSTGTPTGASTQTSTSTSTSTNTQTSCGSGVYSWDCYAGWECGGMNTYGNDVYGRCVKYKSDGSIANCYDVQLTGEG